MSPALCVYTAVGGSPIPDAPPPPNTHILHILGAGRRGCTCSMGLTMGTHMETTSSFFAKGSISRAAKAPLFTEGLMDTICKNTFFSNLLSKCSLNSTDLKSYILKRANNILSKRESSDLTASLFSCVSFLEIQLFGSWSRVSALFALSTPPPPAPWGPGTGWSGHARPKYTGVAPGTGVHQKPPSLNPSSFHLVQLYQDAAKNSLVFPLPAQECYIYSGSD